MTDISRWLTQHGLADYIGVFESQQIEFSDLAMLGEADLRELELPLGPRKRLLAALEELREARSGSALSNAAGGRVPPHTGQAERRQLTLLFADLVGSTRLAQRVDMEDLREITRAYQRVAEGAIQRFDGHIARYMGDGILAYFGYPLAHEDDAERAVRAGLALVAEVPGIKVARLECRGSTLAVRVGIATGPVLVGDVVGEGGSQEWVAVGETPNLAARIEAAAAPDSVAVAPSTHRLTAELFAFESMGALALKGIDDPIECWRVVREREVQSRFRTRNKRRLTRLVGRDDELELLLRRWRGAAPGEGHTVALSGEPGIGKSRLCEALRSAIESQPHVWLHYQCSPHHVNTPFHPLKAQLTHAAGLGHVADSEARRDALETLLRATPGCSDDDVEALTGLLELGPEDGAAARAPEECKARAVGALLAQLGGLARTAPVLCVFEDLHWADASTLDVLDHLVPQLDAIPVLLVLTTRPEFTVPWVGQAGVTLLSLGRMGARDSVRLVEAAFRGANLPAGLVEHIASRADGVPLFIEELAQAALELPGGVGKTDAPGAANAPDDLAIPETLRDALTARLDRNPSAREVAQLASVIGRDFDYALLLAASGVPVAEIEHGIGLLADGGLVQLRGAVPHAQCRFKHALIRDVAYASLTRQRRVVLHLKVAEALVGSGASVHPSSTGLGADSLALIAYHFTEAGATAQAVEYWTQAGDRALAQGAQPEAAAHFEQALRLLGDTDTSAERGQCELSLLLRLGQAQFGAFGGAAPLTAATFDRAVRLSAEHGDVADRCRAHYGQWLGLVISGQLPGALAVAEGIADLATNGEAWICTVSNRLRAAPLYMMGRLDDAGRVLRHVVDSAVDVPAGFGHDPMLTAPSTLAHVEWLLGYADRAKARALETAEVIRAKRTNPNTLSYALAWHTMLAMFMRDDELLHAVTSELRAHAERTGGKFWAHMCAWGEAFLLTRGGDPERGLRVVRDGIRGFMDTGALQQVPTARLVEAEALLALGNPADALGVLDAAEELVRRTSQVFVSPELLRLGGDAQLALCEAAQAEARYREAIRIAAGQQSRSWQLRAATSLAALLREQSRGEEARELLAPVYDGFREGFGTADLARARALLDELA